MSTEHKPHIRPETVALARTLIAEYQASTPRPHYTRREIDFAYAVVGLEEQLETARVWEHTAKANGDDYQRLKEQLETARAALERMVYEWDLSHEITDDAYDQATGALDESSPARESVLERKAREERESPRGAPPSLLPDPDVDLRGASSPASRPPS